MLRGRGAGGRIRRGFREQAFGLGDAEGFILRLHPFRVGVAAGRLAVSPEPALGRTLQKRIEEGRRDRHARNLRLDRLFQMGFLPPPPAYDPVPPHSRLSASFAGNFVCRVQRVRGAEPG